MPTNKSPSATQSFPKKTPAADANKSPSELIDARIAELDDWRGELLAKLRDLLTRAASDIVEQWKWNVPVWSCNGIICTGETYKKAVKLTFPKGAALADPARLFNSSLDGNTRRAIDFKEGESIKEAELTALVQAAISLNTAKTSSKSNRLN
jgi:hypothetical protein